MKLRLLKIGKILLILLAIWLVLWAGLLLLLEFGLRPVRIKKIDESDRQRISVCTGITLTSNAEFVEGWDIPGRDPSYIYIFDLDASQKSEAETDEEYLRSALQLNVGYTHTSQILHSSQLTAFGYEFQWTIEYLNVDYNACHYAYIHYCVVDDDTIRIALEFGFM